MSAASRGVKKANQPETGLDWVPSEVYAGTKKIFRTIEIREGAIFHLPVIPYPISIIVVIC
jgi:hypothetical protein